VREASLDTLAHTEIVEKELDAFIQRRSRKGEMDRDEQEEIWKDSVRRFNARRREENRAAWCEHFERMKTLHWGLADEYDQKLKRLEESA
jgi:hypothetical protein